MRLDERAMCEYAKKERVHPASQRNLEVVDIGNMKRTKSVMRITP